MNHEADLGRAGNTVEALTTSEPYEGKPMAVTNVRGGIASVIATIALVVWGNPQTMAQSGNRGDGHAEQHGSYQNWHPPNNPSTSCCSDADCRPTKAKVGEDGFWYAWNGYRWLQVEWGRLLPPDLAGDGRSHICAKGDMLYCFTPGEIRG